MRMPIAHLVGSSRITLENEETVVTRAVTPIAVNTKVQVEPFVAGARDTAATPSSVKRPPRGIATGTPFRESWLSSPSGVDGLRRRVRGQGVTRQRG